MAAAIGLGSMDMPIPQIASWEWANWKFPKSVKSGETIYARWTLTQKRPAVGGSPTAIAVWRVDVHTADGALCAEGEVGATVFRRSTPATADGQAPASGPRRRRRRRGGGPEAPAAAAATPAAPPPSPPTPAAGTERASGQRRRRRRRSGGKSTTNGGDASPAAQAEPAPEPAPPPAPGQKGTLRRVIGRLRRT
jgi:hypothetical protein